MELERYTAAFAKLSDKKKAQKKQVILATVIAVVVGFAIGILYTYLSDFVLEEEIHAFSLFLSFLGGIVLQTVFHELGHLFFGLVTGYRFVSIRFFCFAIMKKNGKLKFGMYAVAGTAGQCILLPPEEKVGEERGIPFRLMNYGGIIANIFWCVVFAALCFLPLDFSIRFFFGITALLGLYMALVNGIPMKTAYVSNDGKNVKTMERDKAALTSFCHQLRIVAAMTEGLRLREMPDEWFLLADDAKQNAMNATIQFYAAQRLLDQGNFQAAKEACLALLDNEGMPYGYLYFVLNDLLYLELVGEHRREVMDPLFYHLSDFYHKSRNSLSVIRTQTAFQYLFVGDLAAIGKMRTRFDQLTRRYPFTGDVAYERMLMGYAEAIYNEWKMGR